MLPDISDMLQENLDLAGQPKRIREAVFAIEDAAEALALLDRAGRTVRVDGRLRRVAEIGGVTVEAEPVQPGEISISVSVSGEVRRRFTLRRESSS